MFFLQVISGLLAISRRPASRKLRTLGMATSVVIVLLMWGECFRVALYRALEVPGVPEIIPGQFRVYFCLVRELGWWWAVNVMLVVRADFLWDSPVVRRVPPVFGRLVPRTG